MTEPAVAVGAVVVHDGRLLLVLRKNAPAAGRWSIPGGRVETGERVRDAVAREVYEETGIAVTVEELAGWVERIDDDHHYVILDFFAHPVPPVGAPVAADDAADARWVAFADIPALTLVDGLADFLRSVGSVGE